MALITYPNKNTGDTFSGSEATEIKNVVNTNRNESDAALALRLLTSSIVEGEVPSGAMNDINLTFTLANTPVAGSVKLYWNGQKQRVNVGFTISGVTIIMTTAPSSGDTLEADYRK